MVNLAVCRPKNKKDSCLRDNIRNSDWAAMCGINSQPESQKTELHHANQWACQAQMESRRMLEEFTTKRRLCHENHALDCM